jgi:phage shock protein PspC (stress-responsive transcriptional regulator)
MNAWKQKLSSRKLWAAVAGVVAGLAMVFGLDENIITEVSGAIMAVASVITYIITEGKIDAARIENAVVEVFEAVEAFDEDDADVRH